jgi:hypothetical protein
MHSIWLNSSVCEMHLTSVCRFSWCIPSKCFHWVDLINNRELSSVHWMHSVWLNSSVLKCIWHLFDVSHPNPSSWTSGKLDIWGFAPQLNPSTLVYWFTPIVLHLFLGRMQSGLMDDGAKLGLLGVWMALLTAFDTRKFQQPIKVRFNCHPVTCLCHQM